MWHRHSCLCFGKMRRLMLLTGTGEIKPAANHFYSIDRAAAAEPKRPAEIRVERDYEPDHIARFDRAIDFTSIDAGEERVRRRIRERQSAAELRHRLDCHDGR